MTNHFKHFVRIDNTYHVIELNKWCYENVTNEDYHISDGYTIYTGQVIIYSFRDEADLLVFKLVHSI